MGWQRLGAGASAVLVTLGLGVLGAAPASAAEQQDVNLDCEYRSMWDIPGMGTEGIAQTITAGLTGSLTRIVFPRAWRNEEEALGEGLRVTIQGTTGVDALPDGVPVAEQVVAEVDVPDSYGPMEVVFDSPAAIVAGTKYAIVVERVSGGDYELGLTDEERCASEGGLAYFVVEPPEWVALPDQVMMLVTYVNVGSSGPASSPSPQRTLTLDVGDSGRCSASQVSGPDGTWSKLPDADQCTPSAAHATATLLGWSTHSDFPVATAQRQLERGWGTWDGDVDGVRMIFIPAGGSAFLTGDNTLYPIWSR